MINEEDLQELARIIVNNIKKEFELKHLSKNLVNTIKVTEIDGEVKIHIPAQTYDMLLYREKGVIKHTNKGSYANQLNETGSVLYLGKYTIYPHNHIGFVEKAINDALQTWKNSLNERYEMTIM